MEENTLAATAVRPRYAHTMLILMRGYQKLQPPTTPMAAYYSSRVYVMALRINTLCMWAYVLLVAHEASFADVASLKVCALAVCAT